MPICGTCGKAIIFSEDTYRWICKECKGKHHVSGEEK